MLSPGREGMLPPAGKGKGLFINHPSPGCYNNVSSASQGDLSLGPVFPPNFPDSMN